MSKLTIDQWTDYLNRKTLGFNCPICGRNRWQTQPDNNGDVLRVRVSDGNNSIQAVENRGIDFGRVGEDLPLPPPSLLQSLVVIRCGHCGWVGLFDHKFVEEHLNDAE